MIKLLVVFAFVLVIVSNRITSSAQDVKLTSTVGQKTNESVLLASKLIAIDQEEQIRIMPLASINNPDQWVNTEKWRYKYIDEQDEGFRLLVKEKSIDTRMANTLYTTQTSRMVDIDFYKYNSGDLQMDEFNMIRAAGPQVDDKLCGQHLESMLGLIDDLSQRLASRRKNSSKLLNLEEKHFRLAKVLDTFGRYESGILDGKIFSPGSHDSCQNTQMMLDGDELLPSRHCWARLKIDKHLDESLKRRQLSWFETNSLLFSVGACLPGSCHSKSFKVLPSDQDAEQQELKLKNKRLVQLLINTQFKMPDTMYIDENLELDQVFCPVDEQSEYGIPLSGKLFMIFAALWLLCTITSTVLLNWNFYQAGDEKMEGEVKNWPLVRLIGGDNRSWIKQVMQSLDLYQSWREFLCEGTPARVSERVELDTLNPIKLFGFLFVIMGHSLLTALAVSTNTLHGYRLAETQSGYLSVMIGSVVVDTFFVITGILMCFVAMSRGIKFRTSSEENVGDKKEIEERKGNSDQLNGTTQQQIQTKTGSLYWVRKFFIEWARITITRHARLVPLFVLVFWFKKSIFVYALKNLPFWDNGFNRDTSLGACLNESWYTPFGIMAAFLPLSKQCLGQAWSVASDLFFSLTIPPILIMFAMRKFKAAIMACLLLPLVGIILVNNSLKQIDSSLMDELLKMRSHGFVLVFGQMTHIYTYPHYRFGSILVGVIAGWLIHEYKQAKWLKDWPAWFKGPVTWFAISSHFIFFAILSFVPQIKGILEQYHTNTIPHMFSSGRLLWVLINALVMLRMTTDWRQNFLMRTASSRFFRVMSKLNYAILMVHMDFILFLVATNQTTIYFSKMTIYNLFAGTVVFSVLTSIFLHVVFEAPVDKLMRRFVLSKI